jgi:WD40 repeat protein
VEWGTVALADPENLAPVRYLCNLPESALSVAFSPDGSRLAAGCGDRTVRLFDPVSGRQRKVLKVHADWVQTVAFSADSGRLLTASRDRTARIIDPASGEVLASYTSHESPLLHGAFSPADARAWTVARGGVIHRWEIGSGEKKGESKGADFLAVIPLGKAMLAFATDRKLRLFENEKQSAIWDGPDSFPHSAALSPDGAILAIGGTDGVVTLLSSKDGEKLRQFAVRPE